MYFKLKLGRKRGKIIYPVPRDAIMSPKYNKELTRCVCILDYDASDEENVEEITEEVYNRYPLCNISVDKKEISKDLKESLNVTIEIPEPEEGIEVLLVRDGKVIDFANTDADGKASFNVQASSSASIMDFTARPRKTYEESDHEYVKVT